MKITDKIISIPPYISTSWNTVSSLHKAGENLIVTLFDKTQIAIPDLSEEALAHIFSSHATFLELSTDPSKAIRPKEKSADFDPLFAAPIKLIFGTLDSVAQALQHNPANSDLPPIPPQVAAKLAELSKIIPKEDLYVLPSPVAECNCMYCQMIRIMRGSSSEETTSSMHPDHPLFEKSDEHIPDDELKFEEWEITSIGDDMYLVTNKLDSHEQYTVFLGEPVGCTCGKPHCDHIIAVLRH